MILGVITAMLHFPIGFLMAFLFPVVILAFFITFIFCMYKAYQHEMFKLPIIGDMVEKMVDQVEPAQVRPFRAVRLIPDGSFFGCFEFMVST